MFRWISQDRMPTSFVQQLATFPWYDSSQVNDSSPRIQPGTAWYDTDNGNAFAYVQTSVALTAGKLVSWLIPATGGSLTTYANTDIWSGTIPDGKFAVTTTGLTNLTTAAITANSEVGNWLWLPNGPTQAAPGPTIRKVKGNTAIATTVNITLARRDMNSALNQYDADQLGTALTTGATILTHLIRPTVVQIAGVATCPVGVALGTVTAAYYTIIQIMGLALCNANGVTNGAIIAGQPCVVDSTGSIAAMFTMTGSTNVVNNSLNFCAGYVINPLVLHSTSSSTPYQIPAYVNFIGGL